MFSCLRRRLFVCYKHKTFHQTQEIKHFQMFKLRLQSSDITTVVTNTTYFRGELLKLRLQGELATELASVRLRATWLRCYLVSVDEQKNAKHLISVNVIPRGEDLRRKTESCYSGIGRKFSRTGDRKWTSPIVSALTLP